MSIEALVPFGGTHAILGVAFVIQWSVELTDSELMKMERAHESLRKDLPISQRVEMLSVTVADAPRQHFGVNKNNHSKRPQETRTQQKKSIGAVHFIRPTSGLGERPLRMVQANKENLAVVINDYKGWDEATEFFAKVAEVLLPIVVNGRPITGAMLQYTDTFTWKDEPSRLQWEEIFQPESVYVAKSAFAHDGLWHSHHGYMQERAAPFPHALLENINVDVVQQNAYRVINVFTSHSGTFKSGAWTVEAVRSLVHPMFDDFHSRNKYILRQLLTEAVLRKIGLYEEGK